MGDCSAAGAGGQVLGNIRHTELMAADWIGPASAAIGAVGGIAGGVVANAWQGRHSREERRQDRICDLYVEVLQLAEELLAASDPPSESTVEDRVIAESALMRARLEAFGSGKVGRLFDMLSLNSDVARRAAANLTLGDPTAQKVRGVAREKCLGIYRELRNQIRKELGSRRQSRVPPKLLLWPNIVESQPPPAEDDRGT